MRALQLSQVKAVTKQAMTYEQAVKYANPGDPFLGNMAVALSLMTWQNTEQDWLRLQAALVILAHKRKTARASKRALLRENPH